MKRRKKVLSWAAAAAVIVGLIAVKMAGVQEHGPRMIRSGVREAIDRGPMNGFRGGPPHPHGMLGMDRGIASFLIAAAVLLVIGLGLWAYIRLRNKRLPAPLAAVSPDTGLTGTAEWSAPTSLQAGQVLDEWERGIAGPSVKAAVNHTANQAANEPTNDNASEMKGNSTKEEN